MAKATDTTPQALAVAVLTVSDTRTLEEDTSGQFLVDALTGFGHELAGRDIVKDDIYKIRAVISQWIADGAVDAVLVTGGTGFSGRDSTPTECRTQACRSSRPHRGQLKMSSNED